MVCVFNNISPIVFVSLVNVIHIGSLLAIVPLLQQDMLISKVTTLNFKVTSVVRKEI